MKHLPFLLLASFPLPCLANVLVVDSAGNGDFTQISFASNSATDGDTILVRPGTYGPFIVNDKSLEVLGDGSGDVFVEGYAAVINLSEERSVLLGDLQVRGDDPYLESPALYLADNQGSIRLVELVATGSEGADQGSGLDAAWIFDSSDVALEACTLVGGELGPLDWCVFAKPGMGLRIRQSRVTLTSSTVQGTGAFHPSVFFDLGGDGADAMWVEESSRVEVYGGIVRGGGGGEGDSSFTFCSCGDGGDGIRVDSSSSLRMHGASLAGGTAGEDFFSTIPCLNGAPIVGSATTFEGPLRRLEAPLRVAEGDDLTLNVQGLPGEQVYLVASGIAGRRFQRGLQGTWLVARPALQGVTPLGTLDASGNLSATLPWGLGSAQARRQELQVLTWSTSIGWRLGTAHSVVFLDGSL